MYKHSYVGEYLTKVAEIAVRERANYTLHINSCNILIKINQPVTSLTCDDGIIFNFAGDTSIIEDVVEAAKTDAVVGTELHKLFFKSNTLTPKFKMVARKPSVQEILQYVSDTISNLGRPDTIDSDYTRLKYMRMVLSSLKNINKSRKGGISDLSARKKDYTLRTAIHFLLCMPYDTLSKPIHAFPKSDAILWSGQGKRNIRLEKEMVKVVSNTARRCSEGQKPETKECRFPLKITPKPEDTHFLVLVFPSYEAREKVVAYCRKEPYGGRKLQERLEKDSDYVNTFVSEFGEFFGYYESNKKE